MSMPIQQNSSIYDSSSRRAPALDELQEVIKYRDFITQLTRRDILTRYKRSFLGIGWTMLNPLGMMLVMTIAFSQLFKSIPGYPAYILSGLIVWIFFSQTTTAATVNLVWGGGLLSRIYFPRTSFAIAAILTGLVNLMLSIVVLIFVILIIRLPITPSILFLPVPILLLAAFSLGVGLLISAFAVYYPDVAEMYQILLLAWMYLTPIFYPEAILPEAYSWWLTRLNPIYHLIRIFRACIYEGRFPYPAEVWPAVVFSTVTLIIGWIVFANKSNEIAYRI
jgi:ABC-type polysaccharide/polyol phosphate export permease